MSETKSLRAPFCCQEMERRVWRIFWSQFGVSTPHNKLPVINGMMFDLLVTFDLDLWSRTLKNNRHRDLPKRSSHAKFESDISIRSWVIALTKKIAKHLHKHSDIVTDAGVRPTVRSLMLRTVTRGQHWRGKNVLWPGFTCYVVTPESENNVIFALSPAVSEINHFEKVNGYSPLYRVSDVVMVS